MISNCIKVHMQGTWYAWDIWTFFYVSLQAFENKPPDLIMEKSQADCYSRLVEALTSIKSVNKTDATTLLSAFGTLEKIAAASLEELSLCPGFGPQKAQKLHKVLNQTFKREENSN